MALRRSRETPCVSFRSEASSRKICDRFSRSPDLDLVLALEHSRLEDLRTLAGRLWTLNEGLDLRGRVEGMLAIQGPWANRRYGGFLGARDVVLSAGSTPFPVSDIAVRIDNRGARLAPLRITFTPRLVAAASK